LNWFVEIMCAAKGIQRIPGGWAPAVPEQADDVRAFLAERHPEQAALALWLRAVVREAEPDLTERIHRAGAASASAIRKPGTSAPSTPRPTASGCGSSTARRCRIRTGSWWATGAGATSRSR
jgi:hypothetical protein